MEPKKRPREEGQEEGISPTKRPFVPPTPNTLHAVHSLPHPSLNSRSSLFADLIADFATEQGESDATKELLALPASVADSTTTPGLHSRLNRPLHAVSTSASLPQPVSSSLFQSARNMRFEAPPEPLHFPTQDELQNPTSANGTIESNGNHDEQHISHAKEQRQLHTNIGLSTIPAQLQLVPEKKNDSRPPLPPSDPVEPPKLAKETVPDLGAILDDEGDSEFEAILAAAKSKRGHQVPRQLHKPKQTGNLNPAPKSSSLFSTANHLADAPRPPPSSLFQVANTLQNPLPAPIGSLFQTASRIEAPSSLFQSASSALSDDLSPPPPPPNDDSDAEGSLFQRSSLFTAPAPTGGSLFSSAASIRDYSNTTRPQYPNNHMDLDDEPLDVAALLEVQEEEDEFDAFLKSVKKTSAAPFKSVVATKSAPTSKSTGKVSSAATSAKASGAASSAQPRKFNAPSVVNKQKLQAATAAVKFKGVKDQKPSMEGTEEDEDLDALLDLLGDEDDGDDDSAPSTPKQKTVPKIAPLSGTRAPQLPPRTPITSPNFKEDTAEPPVPPSLHVLSEEHHALLEDIDLEEDLVPVPSTPKATASNRKFYGTSPSSTTPTSTVMRTSRPTRPVARSTPFSLTGTGSMPIVTTTPSHIIPRVSSPVASRNAPTGDSAPQNARVRQTFTSPTKLATMDGEERSDSQSLAPRAKVVDYGRNSKSSSQENAQKKRKVMPENALFNLYPTDEQRAMRKTLKELSKSEQHRVPRGLARTHLHAYKLRPDIINMTSDSAKEFQFQQLGEGGVMRTLGPKEMHQILLAEGANPKHLSMAWVTNHYRWIVWKLASMERSFPQDFANLYLTPERALAQLKYRFEREINNAQRPPLRKMLEHDASPSMHSVFLVSAIRHDGKPSSVRVTGDDFRFPVPVDQEEDPAAQIPRGPDAVIEVSDGWYCINAICDPYLTRLVQDRQIFPGQKLHIFGATLVGGENPTPPLEITAATMLKLQINGVRRAKWHETLGFQLRVPLPAVRISSLKQGGGIAPRIDAIILRVYPLTFSEEVVVPAEDVPEKENAGDAEVAPLVRFTRTPAGEDIALQRYLRRKEDWLEKMTRRLTMEILREAKFDDKKILPTSSNNAATSSSSETEDANMMNFVEGSLTYSQQEKLKERLDEAMEEEPWLVRQVSPVLRLLICDYPGPEKSAGRDVINHIAFQGADSLLTLSVAQKRALNSLGKAIMTVYNVTEDSLAKFKEGQRIQTSFVAYKGEPFLPSRPLATPHAPDMATAATPSGQPIITSTMEDPFAAPETEEVVMAPLPRLTTTTYSGFEFPSVRDDKICKIMADLFGRVATPFNALDFRLKLRDVPAPSAMSDIDTLLTFERRKLIDRLTISNEFDGVGLVVSVSSKALAKQAVVSKDPLLNDLKDEYQKDIFLADETGQLLVIRVQSIEDNLPPSFELGSILAFRNLSYNGFDAHVGAHSAYSSETTEWVTKATVPAYLQAARKALLAWMDSGEQFVEDMELISSRVFDIQTSAASRAVPTANLTNAVFRR